MESIRDRKPTRLKEFDYSNEAYYYVTICTKNRAEFFGSIENGNMILNEFGNITQKLWMEIPNHFSNCVIDEHIIMPNHIHGILIINHYAVNINSENNWKNHGCSQSTITNHNNRNMELIPKILSQYKSSVTREIRKIYDDYNFGWQKSYYDHIIRNDNSLMQIRHYIKYNPLKWNEDENNLSNSKL